MRGNGGIERTPGLDEKLDENALVIELVARGHTVEQQREFPAHYRGHFMGKLVPDLIVDGKVIADPKVASTFNGTHIASDARLRVESVRPAKFVVSLLRRLVSSQKRN